MFGKNQKIKIFTILCLTALLGLSSDLLKSSLAQEDPSREGLPGRRVGGGTRSECSIGENPLMAIVPETNLGLTTAAYPTFFFYVPQISTPKMAEFVLRDSADQQVYEKTFMVSGTSGILNFTLPTDELPPLTIGKNYQWYFSLLCNPSNRAEDVSVDGWVQRVEPNQVLKEKIARSSPEELAALYATSGLWQDALLTLAQLRRDRPNDVSVATNWANLLQSLGLNSIAKEPLLEYDIGKSTRSPVYSNAK